MFGTGKALSKFKNISLTYDDGIKIVDKFKYLVVIFDQHLSWSEQINHMSSFISKRIGVMVELNIIFHVVQSSYLLRQWSFLFLTIVVQYGPTLTSYHLQILQNKLAHVLLEADIRNSIDKIMENLNWVKLDCRWNHQLL